MGKIYELQPGKDALGLKPGQTIELTDSQAIAFRDRFVFVGETTQTLKTTQGPDKPKNRKTEEVVPVTEPIAPIIEPIASLNTD